MRPTPIDDVSGLDTSEFPSSESPNFKFWGEVSVFSLGFPCVFFEGVYISFLFRNLFCWGCFQYLPRGFGISNRETSPFFLFAPMFHPSQIESRKKTLLLSIESWFVHRDPYFMVYYNPQCNWVPVGFHPLFLPQPTRGPIFRIRNVSGSEVSNLPWWRLSNRWPSESFHQPAGKQENPTAFHLKMTQRNLATFFPWGNGETEWSFDCLTNMACSYVYVYICPYSWSFIFDTCSYLRSLFLNLCIKYQSLIHSESISVVLFLSFPATTPSSMSLGGHSFQASQDKRPDSWSVNGYCEGLMHAVMEQNITPTAAWFLPDSVRFSSDIVFRRYVNLPLWFWGNHPTSCRHTQEQLATLTLLSN